MTDMNEDIPVEMSFSDPTILETEGVFSEVKELMDNDLYKDAKWTILSTLMVESPFGVCEMTLNFYNTKKIYIIDYKCSSGDVFYNPDIRCLSLWAQQNGWNVPEPTKDLTITDIEFWKHFWETRLIDSEYLDKKFGERKALSSDYNVGDEEQI